MKQTRGFTLIEMAIVLVIMTILIGGLAMPLSAQIQARRIAETKKILEEARIALIGYAMTHKVSGAEQRPFLPCPDSIDDGVVDGKEDRTGDECDSESGFLPWANLGISDADAWGNRLRYMAPKNLTSRSDSSNEFRTDAVEATDPPDKSDWYQILSSTSKCSPLDVDVPDIPIIVISHGPNSRGARNKNIAKADPTPPPAAGTSVNELQNLSTLQGSCTAAHVITDNPTTDFDDLVVWVGFPELSARVCPLGCPQATPPPPSP